MNRAFLKQLLLGAGLYLLVSLFLEAILFALSHIPPAAVKLDAVIVPLAQVQAWLAWPKVALRELWPGELSPRWLLWLIAVLNWLLWGALLTLVRRGWRRLRGQDRQ